MSRRRRARVKTPRLGRVAFACVDCGARRDGLTASVTDRAAPACDVCDGELIAVRVRAVE